jgi:septum formation protein
MPRPIVLASASPRRRALLQAVVPTFAVATADVDERQRPGEHPADYARRLAEEKARAAAAGRRDGLVIGADTIVVLDGAILGKPADMAEARDHLQRLRGRQHLVGTAVAVVDAASGRTERDIEWTGVWLRHFRDDEMATYIASGDPLDKAGGYAIQHAGFRPVARIRGSETNVVGLPLGLVRDLLARFPDAAPAGG